jgi:carbamoyl-phosphate synthase large subunit
MPARKDIKKIAIIGAGPVMIGESAVSDSACARAARALREEGCRVAIIGVNPTGLNTDPDFSDVTYVESLDPETVAKILEIEKPDAILATVGGEVALNVAAALYDNGTLESLGIELIGADREAIRRAEDRLEFKNAMGGIGLRVLLGGSTGKIGEAKAIAHRMGFPVVLRTSYATGGKGGAISYNMEDLEEDFKSALSASQSGRVLIERSALGWKEIEVVVLRDAGDFGIVVAVMEDVDPMGVHSGDSVVVAPAQTLSLRETEALADRAAAAVRAVGVVGGASVRFAIDPASGEAAAISVNPGISRTAGLASRAAGYPVAAVSAKLAIAKRLSEIKNFTVEGATCCFEPAFDCVVTKLPRFSFEKFRHTDDTLGVSMKSVGEVIGVGRTFKESYMKAVRALESEGAAYRVWTFAQGASGNTADADSIKARLARPNQDRLYYVCRAAAAGMTNDEISGISGIDPWFVQQLRELVEAETEIGKYRLDAIPTELLRKAKEYGFSDRQLAVLLGTEEKTVRKQRVKKGVRAEYHQMDSRCGEYKSAARSHYSTYEGGVGAREADGKKKIIILGGGPNRIGQGIEFDYCCVHAAYAIKEAGFTAILINSNPETVSTDFDTSDKLYFEPLTFEDVMNVVDSEKPFGVIVQLGGQTPLNLANALMRENVPILGTSPESIDRAEDRKLFKALLDKLNLTQPDNDTATNVEEAVRKAHQIGYPLLVRPSYVLGGRAMRIVYDDGDLEEYMVKAVEVSPGRPVLLDRFLDDAIEVDVDAVADGDRCVICGVMEHIEQAGIHSGDSACCLPPYTLNDAIVEEIKGATRAMARELNVIGLMNVQYAVKNDVIYVLEVNPRASRTVPFVSKATGIPWAKVATRVMLGESLKKQGILKEVIPPYMSVKEAVFPFARFPGVDAALGPEMLSTGEVMGVDRDFGMAYLKSQIAAGQKLPEKGNVFVSVNNRDKRAILPIAKKLVDMGFSIVATSGTASTLLRNGIGAKIVFKIGEGRPNVIDIVKNQEVVMIINTPAGKASKIDETVIRSSAVARDIPLITTLAGAQATIQGLEAMRSRGMSVRSLQSYHKEVLPGFGYERFLGKSNAKSGGAAGKKTTRKSGGSAKAKKVVARKKPVK